MRSGEQVTFHLAFTPERLQLTETDGDEAADPAAAAIDLPAGRDVVWQVPPGRRVITLTAIAPAGGDVSYVALQPA